MRYSSGQSCRMSRQTTRYDPQLLRGNTDVLVLQIIENLGGVHGYGVIKELKARSDGFFDFKEGTIYPLLHRLEKEGFIRGSWHKKEGGMSRRNYRITQKGHALLHRRIEIWRNFSTAMNGIFGNA